MMGLHPCHVEEDWQEQCKTIVETLDAEPCDGRGEIGMDLFRGSETRELQIGSLSRVKLAGHWKADLACRASCARGV